MAWGENDVALDPDFAPLLRHYDLHALDASGSTVMGCWSDFRLAYYNRAWEAFALNNGGTDLTERYPLGRKLTDALPESLERFYVDRWSAVLELNQPWEHTYLCSAPDVEREMIMRVLPLDGRGFLMVHTPVRERAMPAAPADLEKSYKTASGFIVQCAHCRRVRRPDDPSHWDWIPAYVAKAPAMTSHTVCEPCLGFYYPPPDE